MFLCIRKYYPIKTYFVWYFRIWHQTEQGRFWDSFAVKPPLHLLWMLDHLHPKKGEHECLSYYANLWILHTALYKSKYLLFMLFLNLLPGKCLTEHTAKMSSCCVVPMIMRFQNNRQSSTYTTETRWYMLWIYPKIWERRTWLSFSAHCSSANCEAKGMLCGQQV